MKKQDADAHAQAPKAASSLEVAAKRRPRPVMLDARESGASDGARKDARWARPLPLHPWERLDAAVRYEVVHPCRAEEARWDVLANFRSTLQDPVDAGKSDGCPDAKPAARGAAASGRDAG